jgi:hypothetical protein
MIRKIRTQDSIEREKKRNQLVIGIVMTVLIVLSSAGYAIMSREDSSTRTQKVTYGNLVFQSINGYWQTQLGNKVLYFNNLPQNVSEIPLTINITLNDYSGKTVYIVNNNPAASSLATSLEGITSRIQEACLNETDCIEKNVPLKDCSSYLIVYETAQNNSIEMKDKCIYLRGDDFFALTDKLVYRLFNIA